MKNCLPIAVAAALGFAGAASAQEFRVDVHGGWDRLQADGGHKDGFLYGVGVGVDFPINPALFIGLDANAEDSTAKLCDRGVFVVNDRICASAGRDLSVGARLGTKLVDGTKIYALGAYTNARLKVRYTTGTISTSVSDNADGWRIGAGLQHPLSAKTFVKAEYRYSNYEGDFSRHQVLAGFDLNF